MTDILKSAPPKITPSKNQKPTSLEMADQMFKDAFLVKKTRFSHLYPDLTDEELHKMTAAYFKKLNEEKAP